MMEPGAHHMPAPGGYLYLASYAAYGMIWRQALGVKGSMSKAARQQQTEARCPAMLQVQVQNCSVCELQRQRLTRDLD